jgi:GNAT superfamily N-acetyltransferase
MYKYLMAHGELYIIEVRKKGTWFPIGDASLCTDTIPIVIGHAAYRSRGYGKRVLRMLIERARILGWNCLYVQKVRTCNTRARRLYEGAGFSVVSTKQDEKGNPYLQYCLEVQ